VSSKKELCVKAYKYWDDVDWKAFCHPDKPLQVGIRSLLILDWQAFLFLLFSLDYIVLITTINSFYRI